MTRLWFQRVACLVVLGCCLGSWSAAAASVDRKSSADAQVVLRVRQPLQDARVLVRWRRVAERESGQYLLYRGTDRDSLQRVARLAVGDGDSYEVADSAIWEGRRIYQLRYLGRHGREHVLTTVLLELSYIEDQLSSEMVASAPQPLESAPSWPLQGLDFRYQLPPVEARDQRGEVPSPASPPPRSPDTSLERIHAST